MNEFTQDTDEGPEGQRDGTTWPNFTKSVSGLDSKQGPFDFRVQVLNHLTPSYD